jgi:hypothetical protein
METPKEYYYTYYSYEEWGRGYFGSRGCKRLPEEDIKYLGSFSDKNFNPTQKIILKSDYATREEAYADEITLQEHYKVVENPHFANKSYQTSTKFYYVSSKEEAIKNGKKGLEKIMNLKLGIHSLTKQERSEIAKELYKKGKGLGSISKEERSENSKINYKKGLAKLTKEQLSESAKKAASQKWICLETGHISNAGGLTSYQKARGIDTSQRVRVE